MNSYGRCIPKDFEEEEEEEDEEEEMLPDP